MGHPPILRFDLDLREAVGRRQPEAIILQEDRNLVMAPGPPLDLDADDDLDAAYLAISAHRPLPLGRYLVRRSGDKGPSWTYRAVVHDLECRPSCRPGDVRRSLSAILADASRRGVQRIASEPLGVFQKVGLGLEGLVDAFDQTVLAASADLERPIRLTLLLDDLEQVEDASHRLRSRLLQRASRSFRTVDGDAAVVEVRWGGHRFHFRFVPGSLSGYQVTRVAQVA